MYSVRQSAPSNTTNHNNVAHDKRPCKEQNKQIQNDSNMISNAQTWSSSVTGSFGPYHLQVSSRSSGLIAFGTASIAERWLLVSSYLCCKIGCARTWKWKQNDHESKLDSIFECGQKVRSLIYGALKSQDSLFMVNWKRVLVAALVNCSQSPPILFLVRWAQSIDRP